MVIKHPVLVNVHTRLCSPSGHCRHACREQLAIVYYDRESLIIIPKGYYYRRVVILAF